MKLFYTDALASAYMAREFGVKYIFSNPDLDGLFEPAEFPNNMVDDDGVMWHDIDDDAYDMYEKLYIHPDSYHIFELMVGDVIANGRHVVKLENDGLGNAGFVEFTEQRYEIIQRGGKPFFTPKSEEQYHGR